MGDVRLGVVGELHGRPSEELHERGDDEPVAILANSIDFQLLRVEPRLPVAIRKALRSSPRKYPDGARGAYALEGEVV